MDGRVSHCIKLPYGVKGFNEKQLLFQKKGIQSPNTVMIDKESDESPKKKLKGLAGIWKHSLSPPTTEVTSEEKVEQEMWRYQGFPILAIDVDPQVMEK